MAALIGDAERGCRLVGPLPAWRLDMGATSRHALGVAFGLGSVDPHGRWRCRTCSHVGTGAERSGTERQSNGPGFGPRARS
jgi:hypothetical protein